MTSDAQDLDRFVYGNEFKKSVRFSFQNVQNFIVLDAKLEGVLPSRFIFDTGSEYTVILKRELAYLLNMDYFKSIPLYGSDLTSVVYAFISRNALLNLDDKLLIRSNVLVLEEDFVHLDEVLGMNIDGIIGANIFNRYIVHINNRRNYIEFIKTDHFKPSKGFVEIPIEIYKGKPFIETKIGLNGAEKQVLKFLIDSGSAIPLLLYNHTSQHIDLPKTVIPGNLGTGLGGSLEGFMGRIDELELGPYQFTNLITSFQDFEVDSVNQLYLNRNGLIGNALLSRFDVYIDYPREKLYIRPNRNYNKKFRVDKSGLILVATGENFDHIMVHSVLKDSPAAQAGVEAGDVLYRFNGWPIYFFNLHSITFKLSGKEGKKIKLKVKNSAGEKKKYEFNLRSLFEQKATVYP